MIVILAGFTFASCSESITVGSSEITTENRSHKDFENIEIEGVFDTEIIKGPEHDVRIMSNANVLQHINSKVDGRTLKITMDQRSYDDLQIEIRITSPDLREITKRGIGSTRVEGFRDLRDLEINHFGIESFSMEGKVDNLTINKSGIGSFEGYDLQVMNCRIEQDGIGETMISCSDSLTGELAGIGNIYYKGSPIIAVEVTGIGNVQDAN